MYNFDGNITHGLQLTIGETVHILEECAGKRDLILIIDSQLVYQQSFNAKEYFLIDLSCYLNLCYQFEVFRFCCECFTMAKMAFRSILRKEFSNFIYA